MKKKSKREREIGDALKFVHDFRKWRWEFLRLNEEYQKDYDAIEPRLLGLDTADKEVRAFSEKWLILPHDYKNDTPPVSTDLSCEPLSFCYADTPFAGNCSLPVTLISSKPLKLQKFKIKDAPKSVNDIPDDIAQCDPTPKI